MGRLWASITFCYIPRARWALGFHGASRGTGGWRFPALQWHGKWHNVKRRDGTIGKPFIVKVGHVAEWQTRWT